MAPTASHERQFADTIPYIRSILSQVLHARFIAKNERRGESDSMPSGQIAGFAAAIAILSAIIIGYVTYRIISHYRALRRDQPRTHPNRYKKGSRISEIAIPDPNNYSHHPPMSSAMSPSSQYLQPLSSANPSTSSLGATGKKTPRLDWRPPTLTTWTRSSKAATSERDAELGRGAQDHLPPSSSSDGITFPTQTYTTERGKLREKMALVKFGLGFGGGGRGKGEQEDESYLMMNGSPPVGSPPPQYARNNETAVPVSNSSPNRLNGAGSPPLPPIPHSTTTATTMMNVPVKEAQEVTVVKSPIVSTTGSVPEVPEPSSTSSEPSSPPMSTSVSPPPIPARAPSRSSSRAPTLKDREKGSRLTSTTIASHSGRISTVIVGPTPNPSPRVSSLYHSRHSSHSYTPASPGLPAPVPPIPPIPPMPPLPAHLLGRTPSIKTMHTKTDSFGSMPGHGLEPENIMSPSAFTQASSSLSPSDQTKGIDGQALPRTMVVTATFTPSLSDELPLTIGETVSMLEEYIDGWCFVQRVKIMVKPNSAPNSPLSAGASGGIMVSVHGTIDTTNTIPVPVEGEGNSGAVPRFCVSEWPLAASTMAQMQGTISPEILISPREDEEVQEGQQSPRSPSLPSFLPSVQIDPETAAKIQGQTQKVDIPHSLPPPSFLSPVNEKAQNNSKFSSWGSAATPAATGLASTTSFVPKVPSQLGTSVKAAPSLNIPPPPISPPKPTLITSTPVISKPPPPPPSEVSPVLPKAVAIVANADNAGGSRVTSTNSEASFPAPNAPPTSPASVMQPSPETDKDNVKRVSKPPPAPRLSRFPSQDRDFGQETEVLPVVPKASERTMTMPALARGQSLADTLTFPPNPPPPAQGTFPNQPTVRSTVNNSLSRMDSTTSGWTGSSTGSTTATATATPLTAQTTLTESTAKSSSASKRFTSAVEVTRNGSISSASSSGGRVPSIMSPSLSTGMRPGTSPSGFGPRAKPGGAINFKSLRTGSTTTTGLSMSGLSR